MKKIFGPCVVQCWANIFRQGEGIKAHKHSGPGRESFLKLHTIFEMTGNLFLYGDLTTGTYYKFPELDPLRVKYDNKIGELTLFPPTLVHGVTKNTSGDMRISMAIDVRSGDENHLNTLISEHPKRYYYIR